jgi:hypothetical protein
VVSCAYVFAYSTLFDNTYIIKMLITRYGAVYYNRPNASGGWEGKGREGGEGCGCVVAWLHCSLNYTCAAAAAAAAEL